MKKLLDGIVPYNDLYYSYCLYNSLFSAIKYHNVDILPIMINGIPEYSYIEDLKKIGVYYTATEEQEKIMNKIGLKTILLEKFTDFHEFIKQSIDNGGPVIVNIDWFYMPNQKQTYNKTHRMHTIIVIGYDDNAMYSIFDQKFVDTLSYTNCEISFDSLKEAYSGYLDLYNKSYSHGVFSVQKFDNQVNHKSSDYKKIYIENILNKEYFNKRLYVINDYLNNINELLDDTNFITEKFNSVLSGLNDIINHKNVEKFIYSTLFKDEIENINIIEKTVENWNIIRSKLLKSSFEGIIDKKDKIRIVESLLEIKECEEKFCSNLPLFAE